MPTSRTALAVLLAVAGARVPALAQNPLELLHQQSPHYWFAVEAVAKQPGWLEAADDFDVVAALERVRIGGHNCWSCAPGDLVSARLAFYAWTPDGPGALQQEYVFQDGDPGLAYTPGPGGLDLTLPVPFAATGKHFLSAQVEVVGYWSWWAANYGEPLGATVYTRTDPAGAWSHYEVPGYPPAPAQADLAFELYGTDATPPTAGTDPAGPWTVVPTPPPSDGHSVFLHDVAASASDDVWAVGGYSQVAGPFQFTSLGWIQRFDGASWSQVPSPNPAPYPGGANVTLYALATVAPDDVWAAGTYRTQAPDGYLGFQVFVVHWDGASWTQVPAPMTIGGSGSAVLDIEVVGAEDIWFLGHTIDFLLGGVGEQRALALHWDGEQFTKTLPPFFDNYGGYGGGHAIESASALAPDDVWAVGGAHGASFSPHSYIAHWDGSAWTHVPGPTPGLFNRLYAVEALAPDDVWATGYYMPEGGGAFVPFALHWDGGGWSQVDLPGGGKALLHRPAQGDLIAADGINAMGGIFRHDGTSWQPVMDFPTVANPNFTRLALVPGTGEVWGVGRQNGPDVGALTARLVPDPDAASVEALEPCSGVAPPESLLASPAANVGKHVSFAVGDPTSAATVAPGSLVVLALGAPAPGDCGLVLAGFGPDLAAGELLLGAGLQLLPAAAWGGPEAPAVFDVAVPAEQALAGAAVAAQGAFLDPQDGDVVLTRGLLMTIGA